MSHSFSGVSCRLHEVFLSVTYAVVQVRALTSCDNELHQICNAKQIVVCGLARCYFSF